MSRISLEKAVTRLNEVVVVAKKNPIEVYPDKLVFNIASNVAASGSNGLDLLAKAPGVTLDPDQNIVVMGKPGARVFINGRPSRLSGADLVSFLRSLSADQVESIEIITNPSAAYEAEGRGGIINIRLKKNLDEGFNGSVGGNYSKGTYVQSNQTLSLNYQKGKVNFYNDVNFSHNVSQFDLHDTRTQNGYMLEMAAPGSDDTRGLNLSSGIDFTINKKHSLSLTGRSVWSSGVNENASLTKITTLTGTEATEFLKATSTRDHVSTNYSANLNYQYQPNPATRLSVDVSAGRIANDEDTWQPNYYLEEDGVTAKSEVLDKFNADNVIGLFSAQADLEKTLGKVTMATGGKYYEVITSNDFRFYNVMTSGPALDLTRSNDFSYVEKVLAGYVMFNGKFGKKVSANAGVRVEQTSSEGILISEQPMLGSNVKRTYINAFPTMSVSLEASTNSRFSLSIGRRISRPPYQDMNPFEVKRSELSIFKGNPFLKPNYTMNYDFIYLYKNKLTIMNSYSVTVDDFASILIIDEAKRTFLIPQNIQDVYTNTTMVSYPVTIARIWDLNAVANYSYTRISGAVDNAAINLEAKVLTFTVQNSFILPGDIRFSINYMYLSPFIWRRSLKIDAASNFSFGISKNFWKDQLQIRLTGNDVFNDFSDFRYRGNYGGLDIDGFAGFDNRRYGVGAVLKFGNQKMKGRSRKKSALDEQLDRAN